MPKVSRYKDYIVNIYNKLCLMSALLMVIQTIALKTLGICIPGVLTFLPLTDTNMYDYASAVIYHNSGRCMSFFAEPSHFAIFVLPFLVINLMSDRVDRKRIIQAIFVSISLIMCASFTGVLSAIIIWGLFILINVIKRNISFKFILLMVFACIIFITILLNTSGGEYLFDEEIYERQSEGRFAGFMLLDILDINGSLLYFGNGMVDIGELLYLPGWPRLLYYYGIVGTIIYILSFMSCAKRKTVSVIFLILLGILMIGTEVNFNCYFVIYMLCIYITNKMPLFH